MTNQQLYFAIGIPCLTILARMALNLFQIFAVRGDVRDIRGEMRDMRSEMRDLRSEIRSEVRDLRSEMRDLRGEINTKLDLILAKIL